MINILCMHPNLTMPGRGARSLPSCLGGGDLDGDIYNLILDVSHTSDLLETSFHAFLAAKSLPE